ncbi:MAG: SUMF1/EgtB/PvdO family nonheme iron enzyme [Saprospiraceae bacterium]|nr:SUMF1/EgtB/PvdO family nonheme iron enzyme [Saprospiraceae bacterium]
MKDFSLRIRVSIIFAFFQIAILQATNLQIHYTELMMLPPSEGGPKARVILSWDNAWHNTKNHDAVWLYFRNNHPLGGSLVVKVAPSGHQIVHNPNNVQGRIRVSEDGMGVFIEPSAAHRGRVQWTVEIALDAASVRATRSRENVFSAYGVEMVYIPEGSFALGDLSERGLQYSALFRSDDSGKPEDFFQITAENQVIEIGAKKGNLNYQAGQYRGDGKGTIPAAFPKGHQAFYIMKYELTQGEYASFLNAQDTLRANAHRNDRERNYYQKKGTIRFENNDFVTEIPNRPCNFITWDDAMSVADWAGLRPMTELEFEKACRGTAKPVNRQYPWITTSKNALQRIVAPDYNLTLLNGLTEAQLNDNNLENFGASYYWVMDLAGSLWERAVTIGDETGRAFTGTHGDGALDNNGNANVSGWPSGIETSGYGYRGGGYYAHGHEYGEFNPNSPIGYRPFGAWSGGERTAEGYGIRFVRTAPN